MVSHDNASEILNKLLGYLIYNKKTEIKKVKNVFKILFMLMKIVPSDFKETR